MVKVPCSSSKNLTCTIIQLFSEIKLIWPNKTGVLLNFSFPHIGRRSGHKITKITKSGGSQTNKKSSDHSSMTAEFYKNVYQKTFLPNDFNLRILGNKNVFEKFKIGWRHMLVPSLLSRNKFLVQQSNITPKHISKFPRLVQLCLISLLSSRCFIQDCTCLLFL